MVETSKAIRCAIYTRKSTEDGLEQEYNSLDAQYDACAAYALSQRHEGWTVIAERYDDGGFSGGDMTRPELVRLMGDVASGKVDIILLYKIDRLTRSLSDFARIVDVLDKAGASFVSITQSFNTTTSMGRLTLNMLLSFAQFEREVTGERIRDKIAASKRKGIWMGGTVPLGYDVVERRLVVNEDEAKLVCHIMQRYIELNSVAELAAELTRDGYQTKVQIRTSGPHKGGCPFRRGTIYHLLSNRIYRGLIVHKDEAFPGDHKPIVPDALWEAVQQAVAQRSSGGSSPSTSKHPSLLIGRIVDGHGRPMSPTHAQKGKHRYRYYVTRPNAVDGHPQWRVSAADVEKLVCGEVERMLLDQRQLHDMLSEGDRTPDNLQRLFSRADIAAATLRSGRAIDKQGLLRGVFGQVQLRDGTMDVSIEPAGLLKMFGLEAELQHLGAIRLTCATERIRKGHEIRLVIPSSQPITPQPIRNERLVGLLVEAKAAADLVGSHHGRSLNAIAAEHGRCRTHLAKLVALNCLAPDIVTAIIEGKQPPALRKCHLLAADLPLSWSEQRTALGFAPL